MPVEQYPASRRDGEVWAGQRVTGQEKEIGPNMGFRRVDREVLCDRCPEHLTLKCEGGGGSTATQPRYMCLTNLMSLTLLRLLGGRLGCIAICMYVILSV